MIAKIRAIQILSLAAAALLLCAGLLFVYTPGGGGEAVEESGVYAITEIPVNQVAAVTVVNDKMKFGVINGGEELEAVSGVQGNYSQTELRSLVYAASHLSGSRKITDLANGAQYGLDSPSAEITIVKTDNSQVVFSLLSKSSMDGNYYLYSEADQAVYLISAGVAELFLRQETDFFSHTVLPVFDGQNFGQLTWVKMEFNGNGRDYKIVQTDGGFQMESPIKQKLPLMNVLQQLLLPSSALYSDQFVEKGADLAAYGFDGYTLKITMEFGGGEYSALLLDGGDGTCLMADAKTGDIYQLGSESLTPLLMDYTELLSGKAFSYASGDLKSLEVSNGAESAFWESPAEKKEGEPEGENPLLAAVNGAEIASEVTAAQREALSKQDAAPALTMTIGLKSGSTDTIRLLPAAQGGYYVEVNGSVNFTTTESYYQKLMEVLSEG